MKKEIEEILEDYFPKGVDIMIATNRINYLFEKKIYTKEDMENAFKEGKENGYLYSYGNVVATNTGYFEGWIEDYKKGS